MQKDSQYKYALRKVSVGLASVAIGVVFTSGMTSTVHADVKQEATENVTQTADDKTVIEQTDSEADNTQQKTTQTDNDKTDNSKTTSVAEETAADTAQELKTVEGVDQKLVKTVEQDDKDDQNIVTDQKNVKKTDTDKQDKTVSDEKVVVKAQKEIDPTLVKSVTDSLSKVKQDASNMGNWTHIQLTADSLTDSFNKVSDQLPTLVPQLLDYADNLDTASQRVNDNADAIMMGMSYINRWYNITYDDKKLLPTMMFDPKAFGSNLDSIDWLTNIGNLSTDELLSKNTVTTFNQKLAPMLNTKPDLVAFLGDLRKEWAPDQSDEDWFRANTGVHIVEVPSKEVPDLNLHIYHRLSTNSALQEYILPLLNIKNDDMYVVSALGMTIFGLYDPYIDVKYRKDPAVYQEKVEQVHKDLDRYANVWRDHFDFWYRMANEQGKERLTKANIQVWDSYNAIDSSKKGGHVWLSKYDTEVPGMAEFFGPLGKTYPAPGISADATGNEVRYYVARVIEEYGGSAVLSHEMTHNFDNSIYLDGYHRRPGTGQELYATGLFESIWRSNSGNYGLNTTFTFGDSGNRTTDEGPARFQTRADVQNYMHGIFDVTYLLDYAEAEAMVNKSAHEKQLMYSQIGYDPAKKVDVVSGPISAEVADKLKTIDDFIDNNIIASRGFKAGSYNSNSYAEVPMYAPDYAGIQSSNSVSGGITFRKTAFELLAAKGWDNGFIPYISDKYAGDAKKAKKPLSDTYALEKIFNGEYNNDYATFKKAMFQERIDKRNDFKPITITLNKKNIQLNNWDDLQKLMQSTVDQELAIRAKGKGSNLINNLKAAILAAEMKQTDDFRSSIFSTSSMPQHEGKSVEDGTQYDLPQYNFGKSVDDSTTYNLPKFDLDSFKAGESIEDGTQYDLPVFDLNSVKKGESIQDGTQYDLPEFDLNSLKTGESVKDSIQYDLPDFDLSSLKKGETGKENTNSNLPDPDLDLYPKNETTKENKNYELPMSDIQDSQDGNLSVEENNDPNSLDDNTNSQEPQRSENVSPKGSVRPNTNNDSQNDNLSPKGNIKAKQLTSSFKTTSNSNNRLTILTSKNNIKLPQTGSKDSLTAYILAAVSGLFAVLGLSISRRKDKNK